jgi:hypothetical protein
MEFIIHFHKNVPENVLNHKKMLSGLLDTDRYITEKLDDPDLYNLSVLGLKICNSETFWRDRFIKKYGRFKKSEETTWEQFYQDVVSFKMKTMDSRMLPYLRAISTENFDLIDFCLTNSFYVYWDIVLMTAISTKNFGLVKRLFKQAKKHQSTFHWNKLVKHSGKQGTPEITDYFVRKTGEIY